MAGKVSTISKMASKAVKNGMAVVIGLQSTGEAGTEQQRTDGGEFDDLVRITAAWDLYLPYMDGNDNSI